MPSTKFTPSQRLFLKQAALYTSRDGGGTGADIHNVMELKMAEGLERRGFVVVTPAVEGAPWGRVRITVVGRSAEKKGRP